MRGEDSFESHLGRMRSRGRGRSQRYVARLLAAANLARGAGARNLPSRGKGSRGRGAGVGRLFGGSVRAPGRRVTIKARIVRLVGKGAAAIAHLRYLRRDGTTREGERGQLYGPQSDAADGKQFLARGADDRHQFRLIVSAEDGAEYQDLKPLTRRLMAQAEVDLGTRLEWVAVDHYDTGHPHTHILLRGIDQNGRDLVIGRDYLSHGLRGRACELVELDLGPPSPRQDLERARWEMTAERLTKLDRTLVHEADTDRVVSSHGRTTLDQALRAGRLAKLQALGLAEPLGAGRWRLRDDLEAILRTLGERDDIIRTMQREFARRGQARGAFDPMIYDPAAADAWPLVGRVVARGLADEHRDHEYLIVDATDGRTHYVPIGRGAIDDEAVLFGEGRELAGATVRVGPLKPGARPADRTIAAVAGANGGCYDSEAHRHHDPNASPAFIEAHVRRLEAVRKSCRAAERDASGGWTIPPDYLSRVAADEKAKLRGHTVKVEITATMPLSDLAVAEGATWLDRELVGPSSLVARGTGFGAEVQAALDRRRRWLTDQGLIGPGEARTTLRASVLEQLQRREIEAASARLSREVGLPFSATSGTASVSGTYRRNVDLVSGRFALIERAHDFTLLPWRPALERARGEAIVAELRGGRLSWSLGRSSKGMVRDDF